METLTIPISELKNLGITISNHQTPQPKNSNRIAIQELVSLGICLLIKSDNPAPGHVSGCSGTAPTCKYSKTTSAGTDTTFANMRRSQVARFAHLPSMNSDMEAEYDNPKFRKAQEQHFANGGTIGNAPHEALLAYMEMHPERFEFNDSTGAGGVCEKGTITDLETGEVWWYKDTTTGTNGTANEIVSSVIGQEAGLKVPDAVYAAEPTSNHWSYVLQRDWNNQFGGDSIETVESGANLRDVDPNKLAAQLLYDFVIGNTDRHEENLMVSGNELVTLDNGIGFGDRGHAVSLIDFLVDDFDCYGKKELSKAFDTSTMQPSFFKDAGKPLISMDTKKLRAELKAKGVPQKDIDRCMSFVEYRINNELDNATLEKLASDWIDGIYND